MQLRYQWTENLGSRLAGILVLIVGIYVVGEMLFQHWNYVPPQKDLPMCYQPGIADPTFVYPCVGLYAYISIFFFISACFSKKKKVGA